MSAVKLTACTWAAVGRNPPEQGLTPVLAVEFVAGEGGRREKSTRTRIETSPSTIHNRRPAPAVGRNPPEQGLKRVAWHGYTRSAKGRREKSTRTRIETTLHSPKTRPPFR